MNDLYRDILLVSVPVAVIIITHFFDLRKTKQSARSKLFIEKETEVLQEYYKLIAAVYYTISDSSSSTLNFYERIHAVILYFLNNSPYIQSTALGNSANKLMDFIKSATVISDDIREDHPEWGRSLWPEVSDIELNEEQWIRIRENIAPEMKSLLLTTEEAIRDIISPPSMFTRVKRRIVRGWNKVKKRGSNDG